MTNALQRLGILVAILGTWSLLIPLRAQPLRAAETKILRLEQVQLFRSGAVLRYSASGKVVNGSQRWVLGGWAKFFDAASLRVKSSSGLRMTDYRWEKLPASEAWMDSLNAAERAMADNRRVLEEKQVDMSALQAEEQYMMVLLGRTAVQGKGPAGTVSPNVAETGSARNGLRVRNNSGNAWPRLGEPNFSANGVWIP
ncbi:MAG: DUF4140 domain-containing protein [Sphingobacteriia bacterium]|nr:DUF4140 domain-containing protein [Sphingobacteriia bacterium]